MSDLDAIKEIEKIIGKELKLCPANMDITNYNEIYTYQLNENKQVIGLNLFNCHLKNIDFLKKLCNLQLLDLSYNLLTDICILQSLSNLKFLDLRKNQLQALPEWLLSFNLPIKLELDFGTGIYLKDNPLQKPPLEIIKNGNSAINIYFNQFKKNDLETIYEAKLILVGEGGAGKTSLANKIINPDWQLKPENESQSTRGIDVLKYEFSYKNKSFQVNIWDFGGQEIYHQTHQFFLSKRALYFLLADNRKEDTDFYYWLNTVDLLSSNSPLLIIKNEKSNRSRSIPEQQLKGDFNNIKDILSTNLSDNRGLNTIIESLQHFIIQLPHIGSPLPKTWVKVREQLELDNRYYLDLKEYFAICQANGFESEADKRQLSGYLHDLGVCLHFQEDELLDKTLILKPTWATDAVYKVLDNAEIRANFGCFNQNDLQNIWQDKQYDTMRSELLGLMRKFKLCYEIPNCEKHYISPQLLENRSPNYHWNTFDNLLLRYYYDFIPKGIVSQFIVVMHEYIAHNYQWVWKSGVVLEKDNTQAEIVEYYGKHEIHIRVKGQNKKELLNIVSYELDKINSNYEKLKDKCKKYVPCYCNGCRNKLEPYFYDYEKLKERIAHHKYTIECGNPPYIEVDVLKLIDGLDLTGFKNLSGLATKQTIIQIKTGDEIMTGETKHISVSGGTFIDGGVKVKHGDFVSGDKIVNNAQGMSKEEFLKLLQALKEDLPNSGLPEETIQEANTNLQAIEEQLSKDKPNQSTVKRKLEYVNSVLEDAGQAMDTVEKGTEVFNKVVEGVKTLITVVSAASFFI